MKHYDIGIIGAGPAGLSAAYDAAELGLQVLLIDENHQPGGQYLRHPPATFQLKSSPPASTHAAFSVCDHPNVNYLRDTVVWDFPEPHTIAYSGKQDSGRAAARGIILATGAYERAIPFPGWTLPGVMTAGGAQNLLKGQRIAPARTAVVAGNGPLLLATAANLLRAGVEIRAVIDCAPFLSRGWKRAHKMALFPKLARVAFGYIAALRKAEIPLISNHTVVSAYGDNCVESVEVAPLDRDGRPDRSRIQGFETEVLVAGFGLVPSTELAWLCGCDHRYDANHAAWLPHRSDELETSVENVFSAGDGASIGGFEMAMAEGTLAGCVAATRLGIDNPRNRSRIALLKKNLKRMQHFQSTLTSIYQSNLDSLDLLTADTVVCRCEDVTWKTIQEHIVSGLTSMTQLKAVTRCGMGRCQGRNCLSTVAAIAARASGATVETLSWPRVRPPAKPIPVESLLGEALPPPPVPDDPHLPRTRRTQ